MAAVAIIVVILTVAAGAAYFLVLSPKSSGTTTSVPSTSSSTSTTAQASQTTSTAASTTMVTTSSSGVTTTPTVQSTTTTSQSLTVSTTSTSESVSTNTCTATSYTNINSPIFTQGLAWMFGNFSAMTMQFTENEPGVTGNGTIGYRVLYVSQASYKLNVTMTASSGGTASRTSFLLWMLKNGTIAAINIGGYNQTGSSTLASYLSLLDLEVFTPYTTAEFTQSGYFHVSATGTETITGTQLSYTDYQANSLPETLNYCGMSETVNAFSLRLATPANSNYQLITSLDFVTPTNSGTSELILTITALTMA